MLPSKGRHVKKLAPGLLAGTAALALSMTMLPTGTAAPSPSPQASDSSAKTKHDNRPGPKTREQTKQRQKALAMLSNGTATLRKQPGGGATVDLGNGEFVEFPVEKEDKVFTVLAEFGTEGSGRFGRTPGPLHNAIPEPDRALDNSTVWAPDFNQAHYEEMFNGDGESFKNYYSQLSSGRYTATNTVSNWVTVPGNASSYGDNAIEDDGGSWAFIQDSLNAWYADQVAAGRTTAEIDAYLAQFDEWDRYDFDGDGDFNEADGYLDHFQAVHAGEGEEAGADPDAIWSHRWFVNATDYGVTGPTVGSTPNLYGGARIGDSKYFVGDYTVEPENGGLGVFAHEFGHDLGLPDYYDTAGGENGTAFWTLMSSGSWLGHGGDADGIGNTPGLMGPEEKLYLGWLDYSEVSPGESASIGLGPSQHTYDGQDQAIKVNLPDASVTNAYTTPPEGAHAWYSGRADQLNNTLTREVPAASRVSVSASSWYQIESGYDYLYAEYSLDNGATWTQLGRPLTGNSKDWASLKFAYSANGQASLFRFRYQTDGGVNEAGAFIDQVSIKAGKAYSFDDGAEAGDNGWTVKGWSVSTGTETKSSTRYYLLENRAYVGYDATLQVGPYQFSEGVTRPNWVEHFPFQDGMLVWLVDNRYTDNNVSAHPGAGYALPVDARPTPMTFGDGTMPSNRRQPFDATFGLQATDDVCLHKQGADGTTYEACAPSSPGIATFDDSNPEAYWSAANPQNSVKVAGVGVTATVTAQQGDVLTVQVDNP
ncbi:peptidase M6 [Nocardioides sp. Root140]|nr:peptidase M6 [Nocardioides sp. Root140]KRF10538.1 peptidase M6 [Nocardioides sp. Soil796]